MQLNKIFDLQIKTAEQVFYVNKYDEAKGVTLEDTVTISNNLEAKIISLLENEGCMCYYDPFKNLWSVFKEVEDGKKDS